MDIDGHRFSTRGVYTSKEDRLHGNDTDQLLHGRRSSGGDTHAESSKYTIDQPTASNRSAVTVEMTPVSPLSDRPNATTPMHNSVGRGEGGVWGRGKPAQRGFPRRRPGSLDAEAEINNVVSDVDQMTFEQKSRTLDSMSRRAKSYREAPPQPGGGRVSGTLPLSYRSGPVPTHLVQKVPPAVPSARGVRRRSAHEPGSYGGGAGGLGSAVSRQRGLEAASVPARESSVKVRTNTSYSTLTVYVCIYSKVQLKLHVALLLSCDATLVWSSSYSH